MKFFLLLLGICVVYYVFFPTSPASTQEKPTVGSALPNQSPDGIIKTIPKKVEPIPKSKPTEKIPEEVRKSVWTISFYGMQLNAIWVVVVVILLPGGVKILRSRIIHQGHNRVRARNVMLQEIRNNNERVIGFDYGLDEAGQNETIFTQDPYGTDKAYTIIDTGKLPDQEPKI